MKVFRKKKEKRRRSMFLDDFIKDNSKVHCMCELYVPEPSFKYDDFGAVKEICISGDVENFLWSKHCTVHLCELPFYDPNQPIPLEAIGKDFEICLNVTLNKQRKGDLVYAVRDEIWHECRQKLGSKWRTFVLRFEEDSPGYKEFQAKLNTVLKVVESSVGTKQTYLLVAVQEEKDKLQKPADTRPFTLEGDKGPPRYSQNSATSEDDGVCNSGSEPSDEDANQNTDPILMEPPFSPAPFETAFTNTVRVLKNFSAEISRQDSKSHDPVTTLLKDISARCDSLHIHPNELPQTLESVLKSIKALSSELDYTNFDPRSIETVKETDISDDSENSVKKIEDSESHKFESVTNPNILSENILTGERYLPMGADIKEMAKESKDNPKLKKSKELGELLASAINDKDQVRAGEYAMQLARDHAVKVKVNVDLKGGANEDLDKEFNLKVYLEDRECSGGNMMLKVRASDTIKDLKYRMLMKHMFPVEVQCWIIGQRIPPDHETLGQCKVKCDGHSVYLYLVSAKSVNLTKEEFMRRQNLANMQDQNLDYMAMGQFHAAQDPQPLPQNIPTAEKKPEKKKEQKKPKPDTKVPDENLLEKYAMKVTPEKLQGKNPTPSKQDLSTSPGSQNEGQGRQPILENNPSGRQQQPHQIMDILNRIKPDIEREAAVAGIPAGYGRVPVMHPEEPEEAPIGWSCEICTFTNQPTRPGCEMCGNPRPPEYVIPEDYVMTSEERERIRKEEEQERKTREAEERQRIEREQESRQNFVFLQQADEQDIIPNTESFNCPICFDTYEPGEGIVLRECLHSFCKECLSDHIKYSEEPVVQCPYQDNEYICNGVLQDREIKALVPKSVYEKYLIRSLTTAESQAANSFHCKTADCVGWCVYEDHVNFFLCPVCHQENCLTCKAIHPGMNCKQYQEDLKIRAQNDGAARETQIMIKKMVDDGDAMPCPQCQVIVMKKEGCDWIQCSICKTEICWVTKGPRWGPMGSGDISGGCKCRVNGVICDPNCNNCH